MRELGQIGNPQGAGNAPSASSGDASNQTLADYVASITPKPAQTAQVDTSTQTNYNNTTASQGGMIHGDHNTATGAQLLKKEYGMFRDAQRLIQSCKEDGISNKNIYKKPG